MTASAYVVTEGPSDAEILRRCLPESIVRAVEFVPGHGSYSAMSLAGTIAAVKRLPVALVVDADSSDEEAIREREDFLRFSLRQAAAGVPFEVFVAVPQIEVLFFQDPSLIRIAANQEVSESELNAAKRHPKEWLANALPGRPITASEVLASVSEESIGKLRTHPLLRGLSEFLSAALEEEARSVRH